MEDYKIEIQFVNQKSPTVSIIWEARPLIEQIMSPLLLKEESDRHHEKLAQIFKPRAGLRLGQLLKLVCPDPSKGMCRVVISIKLLRELFADELAGFGGGGGKRLKKVQTPLTSRRR